MSGLWKHLGALLALLSIWSSADRNRDGILQASETNQAIARSLPMAVSIAGAKLPEGMNEATMAAMGEELGAVLEKYLG